MKRCNCDCEFLEEFDLFGKQPELYYKGKSQKTSLIGKIFTYFYGFLYVAFFAYKIIRMLEKVDITFYETYAYAGFPSIQLSSENFYGGFALGGMIEETIYYPKAFFYQGHRKEGVMIWEPAQELELEVCKLEKFGKKYQDMFKDKSLENLYCLKEVDDITLEGYSTLESYSYFYVAFFPCIGTARDGRPCMPEEIIDQFFKLNKLEFKMQDIEMTPQIFDTPSEPKEKDIASPIYRHLYQQIYAYMQIVILETDEDTIGFEGLSKIKTEKFLKYEESWIIAAPSPHSINFDPSSPICDVTVQLSAKVLTLNRKNTKLIEVLGDVGGLMEVVWSFFSIIATFISDILYDSALVNNLFSFDLDRKMVSIKNKKDIEASGKNLFEEKEPEIFTTRHKGSNTKNLSSFKMQDDLTLQSRNKLKESSTFSKKKTNETLNIGKKKKKKKKINKGSNLGKITSSGDKNNIEVISSDLKKSDEENIYTKNENVFNFGTVVNSEKKLVNKETEKIIYLGKEGTNEKRRIIDIIKLNNCCILFWFCFVRKKKNMQNTLLDEGMRVIIEKLDILNIFKKMHRDEMLQENIKDSEDMFKMSDTCKHKLQALSNFNS